MGPTSTRLIWMLRRLGAMSIPEVGHRVVEQLKRLQDRTGARDWAVFGAFEGGMAGLPGLDVTSSKDPACLALLKIEAEAALAGRFTLLNQRWPTPTCQGPWWRAHDIWRTDPVTGRLWPGAETSASAVDYRHETRLGDVKFVWELNRLQMLPALALHAAQIGDADMAEVFDILQGWMAANPPGRGVNWTSGIEAASRVVSLLAVLACVQPRTARQDAAMRAFLHAHIRWIARYPSRFSSANNHRVAERSALAIACACAPGLPGARALLTSSRRALDREMGRQFHQDGVGAEQSLHYAAYSLEWFVLAAVACDRAQAPFAADFRTRMRRATCALRWLIDVDGRTPAIGDSDGGRALALTQAVESRYAASVTAMAERWLGQNPLPRVDQDRTLRDLILPISAARSLPDTPRPVGARTFIDGGLTVWRKPCAGGPLLLAFDHGALGSLSIAAHGHADALAIWLHLGDEAVFVGPGTYLYHGADAARDDLRGTAAHNTLNLDGEDQSRIIGPFAWSAHARTTLLQGDKVQATAEHGRLPAPVRPHPPPPRRPAG